MQYCKKQPMEPPKSSLPFLIAGNQAVEVLAARTILRNNAKVAELAQLKKPIGEMQRAAAPDAKQINHLKREAESFQDLLLDLRQGTFTRPDFVTPENWQKMIIKNCGLREVVVRCYRSDPGYPENKANRYDD
jgi:hypothetical protein